MSHSVAISLCIIISRKKKSVPELNDQPMYMLLVKATGTQNPWIPSQRVYIFAATGTQNPWIPSQRVYIFAAVFHYSLSY